MSTDKQNYPWKITNNGAKISVYYLPCKYNRDIKKDVWDTEILHEHLKKKKIQIGQL